MIGAGQLSTYLCRIVLGLDYQVTVCDPREAYREEWNIAGATLVHTMPDDTVEAMRIDARSAVVALTHDPKLDDLALMEALRTPAFYVGALGSRRNNAARRERLRLFDLDDARIARLHGPAGIYIGSPRRRKSRSRSWRRSRLRGTAWCCRLNWAWLRRRRAGAFPTTPRRFARKAAAKPAASTCDLAAQSIPAADLRVGRTGRAEGRRIKMGFRPHYAIDIFRYSRIIGAVFLTSVTRYR